MEYIAVLNNYLEYSLDNNHALNLSFQSTSMHVFHAAVSIKCCYILNLTDWNLASHVDVLRGSPRVPALDTNWNLG